MTEDAAPSTPTAADSPRVTGTRAHSTPRRILVAIVLPCVLGAAVIGLRVQAFGDPSALLAIGPENASYDFVLSELPDAYVFEGNGFDGMVFFTIARHPLDVRRTAEHLKVPTYQLRRIGYPLAAKAIAPSGGVALIWALSGLSLLGVAVGGWALSRFPHAPPWLPVTMVINAGTVCALFTATADALAAGVSIAAISVMFRRRLGLAIALLAVAGLTRETSLIAVLTLATWPGLVPRQRVAAAVVPFLPVGLWSIYVSLVLDASPFDQPDGGTFTAPFLGWIRDTPAAGELVLAVFTFGLMIAAIVIGWHAYRPIALYLVATLVVFVCATPIITQQWLGFARITTVAFPLSVWLVVARLRAPRVFARRNRRAASTRRRA